MDAPPRLQRRLVHVLQAVTAAGGETGEAGQQQSSSAGVCYRYIDFSTAILIGYGDSSWASALDHRSQTGWLIFLAEAAADSVQGGLSSLLAWSSHRVRRVCRSTLASETMAVSSVTETLLFLQTMMADIVIPDFRAAWDTVPINFLKPIIATDARSLYDFVLESRCP